MKRSLILSALIIAGICVTQEVAAQKEEETVIHKEVVPKEIQRFVNEHFSGTDVSSVTPQEKSATVHYFVSLSDATELEFDERYKIVEIKSKQKLPESLLLPAIRDHLKEYYSESTVLEWKLDNRSENQRLKLDDGTVITFDKNGNLVLVYS